MEADRRSPFSNALRQYREAAGLSQEQLAERAGLSSRGISDLERGLRSTPRLETVKMLADALGLDEAQRAALFAARNANHLPGPSPRGKPPTRLPVPPTSFIGRVDEVEAIVTLIETESPRLLTLTGPGGVGKTRIAIEVAQRLSHFFPDGAIFIDMSAVRKPEMVIPAIADQMGIISQAKVELRETLSVALHGQTLLMVLDNLEQVIDAANDIAWLLSACPYLNILATSRVLLRLSAEHVVPVDPMTLPTYHDVYSLQRVDAVALFVARAHAIDHQFALTVETAPTISSIVTRLHGMPLAIELAASRLRLLTITELLGRLDSQLPVLAGGARDMPDRHRSMRDTIAWSYDLLSATEQAVFRSLAIFPEGCTLETAVEVCGLEGRFSKSEILDAVEALVDSSMLRRRDGADGRTRYRMLQTLQEFGLEQLEAAGEEHTVRQSAYNDWYAPLVRESEFVLSTPKPELWLDHIGAEYQNLRGQVSWLIEQDCVEQALDISIALATFSSLRGHLQDSRQQLELLLAHPRLQSSTVWRMRGLIALGIVCKYQADSRRSYAVLRESANLARELDQQRHIPVALYNLGIATVDIGQGEDAEALFREVVAGGQAHASTFIIAAAYRKLARMAAYRGQMDHSYRLALESLNMSLAEGQTWNVALAELFLGEHSLQSGDLDQAELLTMDAKSLMEQLGNRALTPYMLATLASIFIHRKDLTHAEELMKDALDLARNLGITREIAFLFWGLGHIAMLRGSMDSARTSALRPIEWYERFGDVNTAARCLGLAADVALYEGDVRRSAWCIGARDAVSARHEIGPVWFEPEGYDRGVESPKASLSEDDWQSNYDRAVAMSEVEILAEIKSWLSCHTSAMATSVASGQTAQNGYDNGTR